MGERGAEARAARGEEGPLGSNQESRPEPRVDAIIPIALVDSIIVTTRVRHSGPLVAPPSLRYRSNRARASRFDYCRVLQI